MKDKTIRKNPDRRMYEKVSQAVKDNGGYCPCLIERSERTKCPCEEFGNQEQGVCRCGRYEKIK